MTTKTWLAALIGLFAPGLVFAYVGPGLGAGALGAVLGVIGAVLLGFIAVVWYPVKRLIRSRRDARQASHSRQ